MTNINTILKYGNIAMKHLDKTHKVLDAAQSHVDKHLQGTDHKKVSGKISDARKLVGSLQSLHKELTKKSGGKKKKRVRNSTRKTKRH